MKKLAILLKEDKKRLEDKVQALRDMDFGDTPGQDNEEADETEEMSNRLATIQLLEKHLKDIKGALDRIKEGTYGKCLKCKGEISNELLEAYPESNLCKACKAS